MYIGLLNTYILLFLCTCAGALGNTMSFIDLSVRNSDGVGGKCLHWLLFYDVHTYIISVQVISVALLPADSADDEHIIVLHTLVHTVFVSWNLIFT